MLGHTTFNTRGERVLLGISSQQSYLLSFN